jgi:hypothetical protein
MRIMLMLMLMLMLIYTVLLSLRGSRPAGHNTQMHMVQAAPSAGGGVVSRVARGGQ